MADSEKTRHVRGSRERARAHGGGVIDGDLCFPRPARPHAVARRRLARNRPAVQTRSWGSRGMDHPRRAEFHSVTTCSFRYCRWRREQCVITTECRTSRSPQWLCGLSPARQRSTAYGRSHLRAKKVGHVWWSTLLLRTLEVLRRQDTSCSSGDVPRRRQDPRRAFGDRARTRHPGPTQL
jgi:hypothetical protein